MTNEEIKEILNNIVYLIKYEDYNEFLQLECKILDHITNLQQKLEYYENIDPDKTIDKFRQKINKEMFNLQEENKELKHKLEQMYNNTKDTYNEICAEQIDYKLKNERAIEYMNEEMGKLPFNSYTYYCDKLLNILQGDDKE